MNRLTENHIIPCYDTDASWRLKPVSFMNLAQEMANRHATILGFGYDDLIRTHTAWVLSRMHIKFIDTPLWRDEVTLTTWHKGLSSLYFLRDFLMKDRDDNVRVKATTSWIVLDLDSRTLVRNPQLMDEGTVCNDNAIANPADRIRVPRELQMQPVGEHVVGYSDVDMLGHTNNAMYMHWAMDILDYELTSKTPIKEVTINFNHESRAKDIVNLYMGSIVKEDGLHVYVEGKVHDTTSFIVEMIF